MEADKQEEVQRFTELTGISEDRAKYFLEAAAWNFEVCVWCAFVYCV